MSHGGLPHLVGAEESSAHNRKDLLEQVAHKLGLVLPLGYVLLSCVGVVFETLLLRSFQTDFLTYAEPEDFLMAGLRHPVVLVFVLLSVLILFTVLWAVRFGTRFSARYAAWRSHAGRFTAMRVVRQVVPIFAVCYYFLVFSQIYARHEAQAIRAGEQPLIRVEFQQYGAVPSVSPTEGYLVATTGRYVFLCEAATQQMRVIPINAVRQLLTPDHRAAKQAEPIEGSAGKIPSK